MHHKREQVDLMINAMYMDYLPETGELLNIPLDKFTTMVSTIIFNTVGYTCYP